VLVVQARHAGRERERAARLGGQPLGRIARQRARRVRAVSLHHDAELVAAQAAGERAGERGGRGSERAARGGERAVARVVTVPVVDVLEPVEVAEEQRELAPGRQRTRHRLLQPVVERAAVRQARQRILVGERLQAREQLRPPDRRRHLRAQRLGEAHVRRGERRRPDGGVRLQHAPHATVDPDRAGERRAAPDLLQERALLVRQPGLVERDHVRFPVLDEHPVQRGERPRLQRRALLLARVQLAGVGERAHAVVLGLPAADRDAGGTQHLAGLVADRVEHLVEPVRAGHGARDGDQRAQLGLQRPVGPHPRKLRLVPCAGIRALDHRHAAAVEHPQQRGDGRGAELRAGVALDLRARLRGRQRPPVGAVGRHRVPGVADEADAAGERHVLAGEPVGVAVAIPTLVLGAHGRREVGERADRAHDLRADRRVLAHHVPLRRGKAPPLLQDRVGHADLPDVVQQRHLADRRPAI
jgi:hypothetical protein